MKPILYECNNFLLYLLQLLLEQMYLPRMGYTIGIVWCYYTKAWYSIGIVESLKMNYTLYWNYTKYLDCGNMQTRSLMQTDKTFSLI